MSYHLHITDEDRAYLDGLPLSPRLLASLERFIEQSIRNVTDEDRARLRWGSSPPCFKTSWLAVDFFGDRRAHVLDFYVNDTGAAFGVLVLVFVEHQAGPDRPSALNRPSEHLQLQPGRSLSHLQTPPRCTRPVQRSRPNSPSHDVR